MFCLFFSPRKYLHLFLCSFINIYPIIFYKFQSLPALWPPAFNICLCCDSLTRNLYLNVVKMVKFCFVWDIFSRSCHKVFYNLFSINCTILLLSFKSLMVLDTTLAYDVMYESRLFFCL